MDDVSGAPPPSKWLREVVAVATIAARRLRSERPSVPGLGGTRSLIAPPEPTPGALQTPPGARESPETGGSTWG
jgi:hypothetical protein